MLEIKGRQMIALIENQELKIAVYNHKDGYFVQLIDGVDLVSEIILASARQVKCLAAKYGLDLWEITIGCYSRNDRVFMEHQ